MAHTRLTRRQTGYVAVLAAGSVVLAACGSSNAPAPKASTTPSGAASSAASTAPASTTPVFPTVAGAYGTKPVLTFPDQTPSSKLAVKVLSEGTGAVVKKNDLLAVDYLGQIWKGKTFDNSYDRKSPFGTPIGVQQVVSGWDNALVGKKVGSRVLLVVPPDEGYGTEGAPQAGIKGTDTLAFVVDIINAYSPSVRGDAKAVVQQVSTGGVTVTGAPGAIPKVTVKAGTPVPKAATATVLAKSSGAPVTKGLVVMQYVATYFTGESAGSTYELGYPFAVNVGEGGSSSSPFEKLVGVPVGSRVLITTPYQQTSQTGTQTTTVGLAIVVDVIAEDQPAKPAG